MKSCPTCNRTFADETITFCLVDGSILSAPYDPEATRAYPRSHSSEPPPTEILHPSRHPGETVESPRPQPTIPSLPLVSTPTNKQGGSLERRSFKPWLAVGVVVVLALVVGLVFLVLVVSQNLRSGNSNSVARQSDNNIPVTNTQTDSSPSASSQTIVSTEKQVPVEDIDFTGTWTGDLAGFSTTWVIDSQKGNSFSGTLSQRSDVIAFIGSIDPKTRTVTVRETKQLKKGSEWVLAVSKGSISSDGKSVSGAGEGYKTYSWAMSKK